MINKWNASTKVVVLIVVFIVLGLLIYKMRPLITPLIIAGLLAYTLNLAVRYITNRSRLSRKWGVNLVFFLFVAILIATPGTLVPISVRQIQATSIELEEVSQQLETIMANPIIIATLTIPMDQIWNDLTSMTTDFGSYFDSALAVVESTSINLIRIVIIIVVAFYLMNDWSGLRKWLINILPESGRADSERLLGEIDQIWRAYMQGTFALMLIMGIFFIVVGLAIGLPGAVAIGLITGLLSMIPELGPWISGAIAVAIAYFAGSNHLPISNFWFAVLVAGIYLVVTQVKSIWLRPQVMGRFMHMHTGIVFLAIIAAALLEGIFAALVILPLLATVGILGRYIRAKLLDFDPWPNDEQAEESDNAVIFASTEPREPEDTGVDNEEESKKLQSA
jgi:predicted PurR-regulated permease PerM